MTRQRIWGGVCEGDEYVCNCSLKKKKEEVKLVPFYHSKVIVLSSLAVVLKTATEKQNNGLKHPFHPQCRKKNNFSAERQELSQSSVVGSVKQ